MFALFVAVGIIGGIIGGLGMGGGTLLIPLLTMLLGINQYEAQAVNLISFIPMSIVALIIHRKNNLVKTDKIAYIIIPALISSAVLGNIASTVDTSVLKREFGIFLVFLGILLLIKSLFADNTDED